MDSNPTLRELRLEVFRDCPVRCRHCYQAQPAGGGSLPGALVGNDSRFAALIEEFVAMGGQSISLSGGELLLPSRWRQVKALLALLAARGLRDVRINTSLAFTSEAMLTELAELGGDRLRVQVGIDGPSVHDWLRHEGALARALEGCRRLHELGVRHLSARSTLFFGQRVGGRSLYNLGDLAWILEACRAHGIARLKTKVVHPSGELGAQRAEAEVLWLGESDSVLAPALVQLVRTRLEGRTPVRLLLTNPLPRSFLSFAFEASRRDPRGVQLEVCQCGDSHLAIDGDGGVFRCLYNFGKPHLRLGNVLTESLSEVGARASRRVYAEQRRVGHCGAFQDNLIGALELARGPQQHGGAAS